MTIRTIISRDTCYGTGWDADFAAQHDAKVTEAIDEVNIYPDQVLLSTAQTTSSGGQNFTLTTMLLWLSNTTRG
jgi:hypothetical protein